MGDAEGGPNGAEGLTGGAHAARALLWALSGPQQDQDREDDQGQDRGRNGGDGFHDHASLADPAAATRDAAPVKAQPIIAAVAIAWNLSPLS